MIITVLRLNPHHPQAAAEQADLCRMHSRILDATTAMPTTPHRILWAQPHPNTLVIRALEPITQSRLPQGYTTEILARPWTPPTTPGTYRMAAVLNPSRDRNIRRRNEDGNIVSRASLGPHLYLTPTDRQGWLERRLPGATISDFRIVADRKRHGHHRSGRTITVHHVHLAATVTIHDPQPVLNAIAGGVGRDKTWGCGLTIWEQTA